MDNDETPLKVILLGSSGVGKTTLLNTFFNKNEETIPTIAPNNFTKEIVNARNNKVKLNIWDTAGQETYQAIITPYVRSVNVALVCFDYENRLDFKKWIQPVVDISPDCTVLLVITKKDLLSSKQIIEMETIADNAVEELNNVSNFFTTSAKLNYGINELFGYIANCDTIVKTVAERNDSLVPSQSPNKGCCS